MISLVLFAAGVETLITILLVIFFVVVPAIGQLLTKMREEAQKQARPREPAAPREPPRGIQDEIDEFLRRASQRRGDRPAAPRSPVDEYQSQERAVTAELIEEETPVGGRVMRRDLDTSEFTRRGAQLGEEVAQADEMFDERAGQVFGGEVSRLARKPGEAAAPPGMDESASAPQVIFASQTGTAASTALLMSDPGNILQAIVMSEILKRPEERWEGM